MEKKVLTSVIASGVLLGGLILSGCGNSSAPESQVQKQQASCDVSGIVTNIGPLKDAVVAIYDGDKKIGTVSTDNYGKYTFKSRQANCTKGLVSGGIDEGLEAGKQDDRSFDDSVAFNITGSQGNVAVVPAELSRQKTNCDLSHLTVDQKLYYTYAKEMLQLMCFYDDQAKAIAAKGINCDGTFNPQAIRDGMKAFMQEQLSKGLFTKLYSPANQARYDALLGEVLAFYENQIKSDRPYAKAAVNVLADAIKVYATRDAKGEMNPLNSHGVPNVFFSEGDKELIEKMIAKAPEIEAAIDTAAKGGLHPSRTRFGQLIASNFINDAFLNASGTGTYPYNIPSIASVQSPVVDPDCMNSATPGVCRAPNADIFTFGTDYSDVNYTDTSTGEHHRGGALVYYANASSGAPIVVVRDHTGNSNDIERIDIFRKPLVLNDAAKALDTNAQYDLIKDKLDDIFKLNCASYQMGQLTTPKRVLATMVAHMGGQCVTVTFPMDVTKNAEGKLTFTTNAGEKIYLSGKLNNVDIKAMVTNDAINQISQADGGMAYNIVTYFDKLIAFVENKSPATATLFKKMIVDNVTKDGTIGIDLTLNEIDSANNPIQSFVRNPGTFTPANCLLTDNVNVYKNVFESPNTTNNGEMKAVKFNIVLDSPVEN